MAAHAPVQRTTLGLRSRLPRAQGSGQRSAFQVVLSEHSATTDAELIEDSGSPDSLISANMFGSLGSDERELLRGGRAQVKGSSAGRQAVGVAHALNQELNPLPNEDVGGFLNARGRKPSELSALAKQHGTSAERELFPARIGSADGGQRGMQTTAEYDIFGRRIQATAQQRAFAQRPTSLSGGETEDAVLQVRLRNGEVKYVHTKPKLHNNPNAESALWAVPHVDFASDAARQDWEREQRERTMHIRRRNQPSSMPWEDARPPTAEDARSALNMFGSAEQEGDAAAGMEGAVSFAAGISSAAAARPTVRVQRPSSPARRHGLDSSSVDQLLRQPVGEVLVPRPSPQRLSPHNSSEGMRGALTSPQHEEKEQDGAAAPPSAVRRNPITGGGYDQLVAGASSLHLAERPASKAHVQPVAGGRSAAGSRPPSAGPRFFASRGGALAVADLFNQSEMHAEQAPYARGIRANGL